MDREIIAEIVDTEELLQWEETQEEQKTLLTCPQPLGQVDQNLSLIEDTFMEVDETPIQEVFKENQWEVKLLETYGSNILRKYLKREHALTDLLLGHEIDFRLRRRIITWLQDVCESFKCNERTFYLTVAIMDHYFYLIKGRETIEKKDLHLIGVTALFMASKYEGKSLIQTF